MAFLRHGQIRVWEKQFRLSIAIWGIVGQSPISSPLAVCRVHLLPSIQKIVGQSPLEYLTSWRICIAQSWLRDNSKISISEIAYKTGYKTKSAFIKAFHRIVEITPGTYRRLQKNEQKSASI